MLYSNQDKSNRTGLEEGPGLKRAWFCIRTHPKHEPIAAARLSHGAGVEVFNPQLRMERLTRRGRLRSTESLFVNYLFARFNLETMLDKVRYTPSVKHVVEFGGQPAMIPDRIIEELQQTMAEHKDTIFTDSPLEGDEAEIMVGPFSGQEVRVMRVLSAKQRVEVLMEVLGRPLSVEFSLASLMFKHRTAAHRVLSAS